MSKSMVGIDIGYDRLKMAVLSGGKVVKSVILDMPDKMVQQGRVVSVEAMGEMIRYALKDNHIRCNNAAVLLSNENILIRNVTMPIMTADQLNYNLPYEFRDYITEELKDYVFDYAMLDEPEVIQKKAENKEKNEKDDDESSHSMDLLAVAAPKELIEDTRDMTRKAGLHLRQAAPVVTAYSNLLKLQENKDRECCILDLGHHSVRMYIFKDDRHMVTRELENGLVRLEEIVADKFNVDRHLAHTYIQTNHENCQYSEECMNFYNQAAIELMRAVNFYQFSNPDSALEDAFICGGGALIAPFVETLKQNIKLNYLSVSSLIPGGDKTTDAESVLQAVGIALE